MFQTGSWIVGFLTFTSLAFEQNLRKEEREEVKNEEEKQNKSKAAFLITATSPRPRAKVLRSNDISETRPAGTLGMYCTH